MERGVDMFLFLVTGRFHKDGKDGLIAEYIFAEDATIAVRMVVDAATTCERRSVTECNAKLIVPKNGLILE